MDKLLLYTDGGSRNNPGPAAIGFAVMDEKDRILKEGGRFLGQATNNEAEYRALIWGMTEALTFSPQVLECYLDSELIVSQLNGFYKIKKTHLRGLARQVKALEKHFEKVAYIYIPREENLLADALVNEALDKAQA